MGGIADAEQARAEPLGQAVDANGQGLYVLPGLELIDAVFGVGR